MKKIIIAAVAKNGVIGKASGEMPWHVKEEFQHFKNTTLGFPVIMGRKTFQTLGKPLKGRLNIIVTRNEQFNPGYEDVKVFNELAKAISFAESENPEKIFIIGGGQIYKQAMPIVDELLISIMDFEADGEIKFPEISDEEWEIKEREKRNVFEILSYVRK